MIVDREGNKVLNLRLLGSLVKYETDAGIATLSKTEFARKFFVEDVTKEEEKWVSKLVLRSVGAKELAEEVAELRDIVLEMLMR